MERYENIIKIEQIRKLVEENQYIKAQNILDTMDISRIKTLTDLSIIADVLTQNERFDDAMKVLTKIYTKTKTRRILYQLVDLSIKRGNVRDAEDYLSRYTKIAPMDPYRYVFRYCIDKLNSESYDVLISSLEQLKEHEYIEVWAYELAKLYHKAGMKDKCVRECSDIVLWFGDGIYVEKAKLLKAYYVGEINPIHMLKAKEKREAEKKLGLDKTKDYSTIRSQIDQFLANDESNETSESVERVVNQEQAVNHQMYEEEQAVYKGLYEEAQYNSQYYENKEQIGNPYLYEIEEQAENKDLYEIEEQAENKDLYQIEEQDDDEESNKKLLDIQKLVEFKKQIGYNETLNKVIQSYNQEIFSKEDIEAISVINTTEQDWVVNLSTDKELNIHVLNDEVRESIDEAEESIDEVKESTDDVKEITDEANESTDETEESIDETNESTDEAEESIVKIKESTDEAEESIGETNESTDELDAYIDNIKSMDELVLQKEFDELFCNLGIDFTKTFGFISQNLECKRQLHDCFKEMTSDLSKINHLVITGDKKSGKTTLAKNISKVLYQCGYLKSSRVALISAKKLNSMNINEKKDKLINCSLVIEEAELLQANTINQLFNLIDDLSNNIFIILEGSKTGINDLQNQYHKLSEYFTNYICLPRFTKEDYMGFITTYIEENEYKLTSEAEEKFMNYIKQMENTLEKENVLEKIISAAINAKVAADERNKKSLFGLISSGELEENELLYIKPEDVLN
ncbi:MAG: hypothetical protein K0S41_3932 [Anaerocolumna sp.]|nr:hypothetical protein [Anaerocolumna sp.]